MTATKPFYVTTPIYYANAELHIGHAFTTLAADTATRFHKAMGEETYFLTGSDEHGQKVEQAAKGRGITPQAHVDEMVAKFKSLWTKLDICHNDFIRTTDERHKKTVRKVLTQLREKGDIYEDRYQGWYCTPCERFWTEKEVPEKLCPDCKRPVETIEEKNYFFRMSKYQETLINYIKEHPDFIRPESRKNEVLGFLAQPLADLCVSRPKKRLTWGIELPFDPEYVTYVWFDALTNYITAVGYGDDETNFKKFWPASCHLIGKDILTTHSVYWSTMLLALGIPLPECIFAHGWWVSSGGKMSKSVGNVVNPLDLIDRYGLDPFRFFLFREMVFGTDAAFSEESFIYRYNADLANDLGNLIQRTLPLVKRNREGIFHKPESGKALISQTREIIELACAVKKDYLAAMQGFLFHEALKRTWDLVSRLNKYIDEVAPWSLAKNGKTAELDEVFYTIGEGIRIIA
ncbi:MAG: methionine--tRNA ligase, partial [Candidatus Riflebacteria bacterium]|nr:methionine--tRNA ligase [Candidatus Riflebacteria bacterium]